jgi:hypothetical protein
MRKIIAALGGVRSTLMLFGCIVLFGLLVQQFVMRCDDHSYHNTVKGYKTPWPQEQVRHRDEPTSQPAQVATP